MSSKNTQLRTIKNVKNPIIFLNKPIRIAWKELVLGKKGILFYTILMLLFTFWFTTIFNPGLFSKMAEYFENYPEVVLEMVGGQLALGEFGGFINTYIFSFAWMYFGIYLIMRASQDIPKEIDNKTIDLVLSKPINRWQFVIGKYFQHLTTTLLMTGAVALGLFLGIFTVPAINPAEVYYNEVIIAILWLFLFLVALVSTGFFFSTFMSTRLSLAFSFGMMIFFYAIGSFSSLMPEAVQGIKYFSIFYYFLPSDLLIDHTLDFIWLHALVLVFYSVVITIIAGIIFNKRDIPV
ncbi:MAG: ABC transporter permease subunit [Promethearchaeota archaeon]